MFRCSVCACCSVPVSAPVLQLALGTQVTAAVPTEANECSVMFQEHNNAFHGKDRGVPLET